MSMAKSLLMNLQVNLTGGNIPSRVNYIIYRCFQIKRGYLMLRLLGFYIVLIVCDLNFNCSLT
ncbi:hypothetical protein HanPSC8_Chr05g0187391 [Helianthus annuus]|nr:hypothetical protein HanPSC8_Chr05g0187391 [Helianthus annuus]